MQALISERVVKSLRPDTKPYEVRDSRMAGFILRVQPSGVMSYIVQYSRGQRETLGKTTTLTATQARERAKDILSGAVQPKKLRKAAEAPTLAEYVDDVYSPWITAHRKTGANDVKRIKGHFKEFLKKKLSDITPWAIEKWRTAKINKGVRPNTINRDLAPLKAALNKAVLWDIIEESPLRKVRPLHVDAAGSIRYLTKDEEKRLREALDKRETEKKEARKRGNAWKLDRNKKPLPTFGKLDYFDHLAPMVLLSLNTGLRRGELFKLTWADVDLERKNLTVVGAWAKSGNTRHIPLNKEAMIVLNRWKKQKGGTGLVFKGKTGGQMDDIKKGWLALLADAGITDFRWHDIRHTFASNLVMAGVALNTVRELLGHSDLTMTLRYAHLAPEHKAAAVEKLAL